MPDDNKGPGGAPKRAKAKYQVFISSTFKDLHQERERVTWEILTARHIPAGMENFPASDDRGWKVIQRTIDASDYYVLLVGGTYGTYDPEIKMSWTEREYRYALEKKIPVLAFIREDAHVTKDKTDSDPEQAARLTAFIKSLEKAHHRKKWTTAEDLTTKVIQALRAQIDDDEESGTPRPGWYRGDQVPSAGALEEFARLSAENAELKEQLEAFKASESEALSLVDYYTEEAISPELITVPRYLLTDRSGSSTATLLSEFVTPEYEAELSQYVVNLTLVHWVELRIRNTGTAVARNVNVDLRVRGASEAFVEQLEIPAQVHVARTPRGMKPEHHVYVDNIEELEGNVVFVRQRIKQVNPGGSEALVRVGFRSSASLEADEFGFKVDYTIGTERGTTTSGAFDIAVQVVGTEKITEDEIVN